MAERLSGPGAQCASTTNAAEVAAANLYVTNLLHAKLAQVTGVAWAGCDPDVAPLQPRGSMRRSSRSASIAEEFAQLKEADNRIRILSQVLAATDSARTDPATPTTLGAYAAAAADDPGPSLANAVAVAEAAVRALGSQSTQIGDTPAELVAPEAAECSSHQEAAERGSATPLSQRSSVNRSPRSQGSTTPRGSVMVDKVAQRRPSGALKNILESEPAKLAKPRVRIASWAASSDGGSLDMGLPLPLRESLRHPSEARKTRFGERNSARSSRSRNNTVEDARDSFVSLGSRRDSLRSTNSSQPRGVGAVANLEEVEANIFAALVNVPDEQVRAALLQRVRELISELALTRTRVKQLSQDNSVHQKQITEQKRMESRANDLELQNQMFTARQAEGETTLKEREVQAVLEARMVWERGRMAAEDAAAEKQILIEKAAEAQEAGNRTSLKEDIAIAQRLLVPLQARIKELECIQVEAFRVMRENPAFLQQITALRKGKPRWN